MSTKTSLRELFLAALPEGVKPPATFRVVFRPANRTARLLYSILPNSNFLHHRLNAYDPARPGNTPARPEMLATELAQKWVACAAADTEQAEKRAKATTERDTALKAIETRRADAAKAAGVAQLPKALKIGPLEVKVQLTGGREPGDKVGVELEVNYTHLTLQEFAELLTRTSCTNCYGLSVEEVL